MSFNKDLQMQKCQWAPDTKVPMGTEIYKIWAPSGAAWTQWARPVPFIYLNSYIFNGIAKINIPQVFYIEPSEKNSAVFLDLPNYHAIEEGLALAKLGWRPVPLYNGSSAQDGVMPLVDDNDIKAALILGAAELTKIDIPQSAPPVFLLDSNRLNRFKMDVSIFDNSWDLYSQDIPSAGYFLNNGITKIIVVSSKINKDLKSIFYSFQKKGLKIFFTNGFDKTKEVLIKKPLKKAD